MTVADFYHRGSNGLTTTGGTVLWLCVCVYIYIYIFVYFLQKMYEAQSSIDKRACLF